MGKNFFICFCLVSVIVVRVTQSSSINSKRFVNIKRPCNDTLGRTRKGGFGRIAHCSSSDIIRRSNFRPLRSDDWNIKPTQGWRNMASLSDSFHKTQIIGHSIVVSSLLLRLRNVLRAGNMDNLRENLYYSNNIELRALFQPTLRKPTIYIYTHPKKVLNLLQQITSIARIDNTLSAKILEQETAFLELIMLLSCVCVKAVDIIPSETFSGNDEFFSKTRYLDRYVLRRLWRSKTVYKNLDKKDWKNKSSLNTVNKYLEKFDLPGKYDNCPSTDWTENTILLKISLLSLRLLHRLMLQNPQIKQKVTKYIKFKSKFFLITSRINNISNLREDKRHTLQKNLAFSTNNSLQKQIEKEATHILSFLSSSNHLINENNNKSYLSQDNMNLNYQEEIKSMWVPVLGRYITDKNTSLDENSDLEDLFTFAQIVNQLKHRECFQSENENCVKNGLGERHMASLLEKRKLNHKKYSPGSFFSFSLWNKRENVLDSAKDSQRNVLQQIFVHRKKAIETTIKSLLHSYGSDFFETTDNKNRHKILNSEKDKYKCIFALLKQNKVKWKNSIDAAFISGYNIQELILQRLTTEHEEASTQFALSLLQRSLSFLFYLEPSEKKTKKQISFHHNPRQLINLQIKTLQLLKSYLLYKNNIERYLMTKHVVPNMLEHGVVLENTFFLDLFRIIEQPFSFHRSFSEQWSIIGGLLTVPPNSELRAQFFNELTTKLLNVQFLALDLILTFIKANTDVLELLRSDFYLSRFRPLLANIINYKLLKEEPSLNVDQHHPGVLLGGSFPDKTTNESEELYLKIIEKIRILQNMLGIHEFKKKFENQKGIRILSLDGGGTRGVITAKILEKLQEKLGNDLPLHHCFDIICGTSTGGIISILLGIQKIPSNLISKLYAGLIKHVFMESDIEKNTTALAALNQARGPSIKTKNQSILQPIEYEMSQNLMKDNISLFPAIPTSIILKKRNITKINKKLKFYKSLKNNNKHTTYDSLRRIFSNLNTISRLIARRAVYDETGLLQIFSKSLGTKRMIETRTDDDSPLVFCVSTHLSSLPSKAVLWRNYNYSTKKNNKKNDDVGSCLISCVDALRATTAAPLYFPPLRRKLNREEGSEYDLCTNLADGSPICDLPPFLNLLYNNKKNTSQDKIIQNKKNIYRFYADGALIANNPTGLAIVEASKIYPDTPIECVVSIGTGNFTAEASPEKDDENTKDEAQLSWSNIISQVVASATDTEDIHIILKTLLPPEKYFRFNPRIEGGVNIDEVRDSKLMQLTKAAEIYFNERETTVNSLVQILKKKMCNKQQPVLLGIKTPATSMPILVMEPTFF